MLPNIISVHYDDRAVSVAFKFLNSEPWLEREGEGGRNSDSDSDLLCKYIDQGICLAVHSKP